MVRGKKLYAGRPAARAASGRETRRTWHVTLAELDVPRRTAGLPAHRREPRTGIRGGGCLRRVRARGLNVTLNAEDATTTTTSP